MTIFEYPVTSPTKGGGGSTVELYDPDDLGVLTQWMLAGDGTDSSGNGLDLVVDAGSNEFITDLSEDYPIPQGNLPGTGDAGDVDRQCWDADTTSDWKGGVAGTDWDNLRLSGATAVSMQMWVKPKALSWPTLLTSGKGGGAQPLLGLDYTMRFNASGKLRYIHTATSSDLSYDATGPAVAIDAWSHLAITRETDGRTILMYVNAIVVGSTTLAAVPAGGTDAIFHLGSDVPGLGFNGGMRGVQIQDIAETPAKIVENYLRGRRLFV